MNIFKSNSSVVVCNNFLLTDDKDATSVSKIYLFLNESINRIPSESANIQEININGQVIAEDSEIANTFNTFFSSIADEIRSNISSASTEPESYLTEFTEDGFNFDPVTSDYIKEIILTPESKTRSRSRY